MILTDMNEFGGAEEIATTLATSLQKQGHQICVMVTGWVPPDNQYLVRLREGEVEFVQWPSWLLLPATHWPTRQRILAAAMGVLVPLVYLLAGGLFLLRPGSWTQSRTSAYNWLRGQLSRFLTPDRRRQLTRLLLNYWRLSWRPDLLHIHGYTDSLLFVIDWAHEKKLPAVYVENQTPDAQFDWWKDFQQSINQAAVVVAPSERSAQALRNVWIMNTLQLYLDHPVQYSPSIFAYSMIYPYTDNVVDDTSVALQDKGRLNAHLKGWLEGESGGPSLPEGASPLRRTAEKVLGLIRMIEAQFAREEAPDVYRSLLAIFNVNRKREG